MRICEVKDCSKELDRSSAKGLCTMHYRRLKRTGTTDDSPRCFKRQTTETSAQCVMCLQIKPNEEFHFSNGLARSKCKVCWRLMSKLNRYSLTLEQFETLMRNANGRCQICKKETEKLVIDHDHACCDNQYSCGKCVRGILCIGCNNTLGMVRDDKTVLGNMIAYLTM